MKYKDGSIRVNPNAFYTALSAGWFANSGFCLLWIATMGGAFESWIGSIPDWMAIPLGVGSALVAIVLGKRANKSIRGLREWAEHLTVRFLQGGWIHKNTRIPDNAANVLIWYKDRAWPATFSVDWKTQEDPFVFIYDHEPELGLVEHCQVSINDDELEFWQPMPGEPKGAA